MSSSKSLGYGSPKGDVQSSLCESCLSEAGHGLPGANDLTLGAAK